MVNKDILREISHKMQVEKELNERRLAQSIMDTLDARCLEAAHSGKNYLNVYDCPFDETHSSKAYQKLSGVSLYLYTSLENEGLRPYLVDNRNAIGWWFKQIRIYWGGEPTYLKRKVYEQTGCSL
jgi:hypothetical protein